jgi:hypothetical protein
MFDFVQAAVGAKEFWTTIGGAVVGGTISYLIQLKNLREARATRRDDRKLAKQASAHSLQFKVVKIHSNINGIHNHIEQCYRAGRASDPSAEPWQFLLPLVNLSPLINFSADEMGMLLGLQHDDVFNRVVDLDTVHNSLIEAVRVMNAERRALTDALKPDKVDDRAVSGTLDHQQALAIRPRMMELNGLIEDVRGMAAKTDLESRDALRQLNQLLRTALQLSFQVHFLDEHAAVDQANST